MSAPTTNYHQMEDDGNNNVVINNDSDHPNYVHISSAPNAHRIRSPRPDVKQQDSNLSFFETEPQDDNPIPDDVPYVVKQKYGYFAILFSLAQTAILIIMMVKCGIAPFKINPMIGPYPDALSEWGGKNAVNILDDQEYWRLLTPILLHAGVIHLFCNVAVQLETGAFFEREWGSLNWLIIYLTSAVGSSILSCIFMPNSVSVGSSGAVMGLFGGKLAEVMCRCCESKKTVQGRIGHEVRREQLGGVLCSVVLVMAFSFIPYGRFLVSACFNNVGIHATAFILMFAFLNLFSRLGSPSRWTRCWNLDWVASFFLHHQNRSLPCAVVHGRHAGDSLFFLPSSSVLVFRRRCPR
jgi:membrane associated rhomboid family serine protease